MNVGDIVAIWGTGTKRVIVNKRDEIVPQHGDWGATETGIFRMRTVYRLAGDECKERWYTEDQLALLSPRG
tara:strand:- start:3923 stop:4135 length:213 start_codon:yes stop_codon:yes gene_type:complete